MYTQDFELAEKLFAKVRYGGELKLISHDEQLQVDVKVKYYAGARGLGVKLPTDGRYARFNMQDDHYIIGYLAQFKERDGVVQEVV